MRRLALALLIAVVAQPWLAQAQIEVMSNDVPRWPVLVDPVCPVSNYFPTNVPNLAKELRVFYFPSAASSKIKDPQSLTLQIAFNNPRTIQQTAPVAFSKKGEFWEADVSLAGAHMMYAIFYVKDSSGTVDDNSGNYWDLTFCTPSGAKEPNGLVAQAKTYTGENWPLSIHRAKDFDKGVAVLENAIASGDVKAGYVLTELLNLKALREGGDAKAYAQVAAEVEQELDKKASDISYLSGVENFILFHPNDVPAEFVDRVANLVDHDHPKNSECMQAMIAFNRLGHEPDPKKRLAMLDQVIAEYPAAKSPDDREEERFLTYIEMKDLAGAEASLAKIREGLAHTPDGRFSSSFGDFQMLASAYIDKGVKYEEALELLDEGTQARANLVKNRAIFVPPENQKLEDAFLALLRARAYLGLHKPDLAAQQAELAVDANQKNAQAHEILAKAYAETGQKQKALDEYFDAALLPSNYDLKYQGELKRYYLKNYGSEKKYTAELNRRIAERFEATNYVPVLLNRPAPMLDFTTLSGEKFDAEALEGKTVVINFWSPS